LYPYSYSTGDLAEFEQMSHRECVFCQSVIDGVNQLHDEGGYREGGRINVESVDSSPPGDGYEFFFVRLEGTETASTNFNSEGDRTGSENQTDLTLELALGYDPDGWVVREVDVTAQD